MQPLEDAEVKPFEFGAVVSIETRLRLEGLCLKVASYRPGSTLSRMTGQSLEAEPDICDSSDLQNLAIERNCRPLLRIW